MYQRLSSGTFELRKSDCIVRFNGTDYYMGTFAVRNTQITGFTGKSRVFEVSPECFIYIQAYRNSLGLIISADELTNHHIFNLDGSLILYLEVEIWKQWMLHQIRLLQCEFLNKKFAECKYSSHRIQISRIVTFIVPRNSVIAIA